METEKITYSSGGTLSKPITTTRSLKNIISLLRPKQYIKNLFVFAPLFFSLSFTDSKKLINTIYAFIIFSFASSCIYILNDIKDVEEDRLHPEKRNRPIASGKVSNLTAYILCGSMLAMSLLLSFLVNMNFLWIIGLYLINNLLYSFSFKHISILDIVMIALGFLLRVISGGVASDIHISMWLIIMTFLLAIFLGVAKRREDVILSSKGLKTRRNISMYNLEFINSSMVLMAGVIIVSYILYTVSPEIERKFNTGNLFITSFFVVIGILRYMQITFVEDNSGNPTNLLYKDRFLQIVILLWLISFYIIVSFY